MPHHDRADLTGEGKSNDLIQSIILVVFILAVIADKFIFKNLSPLNSIIPTWSFFYRIPIGIIIALLGGYIASLAMKTIFGEVRQVPKVVDYGIFSVVRHPMYLGAVMFYISVVLFTFSMFGAIVMLVAIIYYIYASKREETLLTERFGDDYRNYMKNVPMLFPKLFKSK